MKKIKIFTLTFICLSMEILVGCSSVNSYQEPTQQGRAHIQVQNGSFAAGVLKASVNMPENSIYLESVDGQSVSNLWSNDNVDVTPGRHQIIFVCHVSGHELGKASIAINAVPGRTYTVSYPSDIKSGYTIDTQACKKLIVR